MVLEWVKVNMESGTGLVEKNTAAGFNTAEGVYIIWHGGQQPGIVSVGSGPIGSELTKDLSDDKIRAFEAEGLYAAWAQLAKDSQDGVHQFLSNRLKPEVGKTRPEAEPI